MHFEIPVRECRIKTVVFYINRNGAQNPAEMAEQNIWFFLCVRFDFETQGETAAGKCFEREIDVGNAAEPERRFSFFIFGIDRGIGPVFGRGMVCAGSS